MLRKLPDELIAKIAAGEVVERPASVVKELVENSIDAGSTTILVDLQEGGKKEITVIDNGCGMTAEEAPLALERHATSKISCEEDLFRIRTLGFRGEALPAIAAISWMTLETMRQGDGPGCRLELEGGRVVKTGPSALPRGTRISVRNLFFNTPARLKFLKTKETEFSHIAQWVETESLAHPGIEFTLIHQGRRECVLPKRSHPGERIRDLFGEELYQSLLPFQSGHSGLEVFGYGSRHSVNQGHSKGIYLFVNGRPVRDRLLQHAVLAGYENLMMRGRYPWVVLYLQIPPEGVDVNVHPTKNEVRFAQSQVVHELVRETIRRTLQGEALSGKPPLPVRGEGGGEGEWTSLSPPPLSSPLQGEETHSFLPVSTDLHAIGQVHSTYLICETPEKLILIDQHAAHERIGFEKLKRQFEAGEIARQQLLIPQNFDMSPSETEVLKKYLPELVRFGIEVEFFGGHTFLLRSLPVLLADTDCVALLRDLVATLKDYEKLTPLQEKVHEVLERMACHAQVRAGDRLSLLEIEALLQEMEKTNFAYSCPHGRPAILQIPFGEIEKWFKRRL